jgi:cob(I)alamin adenosyltransferase
MPKLYTKSGDKGTSGLYDGSRRPKDDKIFEVLGSLDELNSHLAFLKALQNDRGCSMDSLETNFASMYITEDIQSILLDIGSLIATVKDTKRKKIEENVLEHISENISTLERAMDNMSEKTPKLTKFILPGDGTQLNGYTHVCRTSTRKVERLCIGVEHLSNIPKIYLNRLSDYFFALGRFYTQYSNGEETEKS